jgi:multidrug transporter EmrE-like cation transporter
MQRLALLSATDMSLVLPATAGVGYVLTSLVGQFWLHETVSSTHNFGLAVIVAGVLLIGSTSKP